MEATHVKFNVGIPLLFVVKEKGTFALSLKCTNLFDVKELIATIHRKKIRTNKYLYSRTCAENRHSI